MKASTYLIAWTTITMTLITAAHAKIGESRRWTDTKGRTITAKLIRIDEESIILEMNLRRFNMDVAKLSDVDQRYIDSLRPKPPAGKITDCEIAPKPELAKWLKENEMQSLEWNGIPRPGADPLRLPFQLHVPPSTHENPEEKLPLIIHLHGTGGIGKDNLRQWECGGGAAKLYMDEDLQRYQPCYVMVPQTARMSGWYALSYTDPSQELRAVVHAVRLMDKSRAYSIDPSRIYITGLSMGAAGAFQAMAKFPGFFAAAVPIAYVDTPKIFNEDNVGPMWVVINAGDRNYEERLRKFRKHYLDVGGDIRTTVYDKGGHNAWTTLLRDRKFRLWLFRR